MSIGVSGVHSLNWTYLDDADGFLQFRVLIRYLELIFRFESVQRLIILNKIRHFILVEGDC